MGRGLCGHDGHDDCVSLCVDILLCDANLSWYATEETDARRSLGT
jgi:hypothetical protein